MSVRNSLSALLDKLNLIAHDPDELWMTENVSDAVIKVNDQGIIHYANPAVQHTFGWTPSELAGRNMDFILPFLSPETGRFVFKGKHKDGTELTLGISFAEYAQEGIQLFVGVLRDRTTKTVPVGVTNDVRHALNQPLSSISTALYLVRDNPSLDDNGRRLLSIALDEMDRVVAITHNRTENPEKGALKVA